MLTIVVGDEAFDEDTKEFVVVNGISLDLEHSLISLSKWESIFEKPFLSAGDKTIEETLEYIKCMVLTPNVSPDVFDKLSNENIEQINKYIDAKMTATWFNEKKSTRPSQEAITSELIYYWLTMFNIPFEVENWHLNRLFTLIKVCNIKSSKPKKMSQSEILERNRALNEARKAKFGTKG